MEKEHHISVIQERKVSNGIFHSAVKTYEVIYHKYSVVYLTKVYYATINFTMIFLN